MEENMRLAVDFFYWSYIEVRCLPLTLYDISEQTILEFTDVTGCITPY